jgi:V/A-type H+-transporting ATPase subunit B
VRVLASVMGQEGLSDIDRDYLAFGDAFEEKLISQATARTLEDSMTIGWEILGLLAETELTRLSNEQIIHYIRREKARA